MVRVDFQIDFIESLDIGTERNYTIAIDGVELDRGIVTFEQGSLYVVVDEIEKGTHEFTFSLDAPDPTPWYTKIYAWNQEPPTTATPPVTPGPPGSTEATLMSEGLVSISNPLVFQFEANPGPPPWAPGLHYMNARERLREMVWGPEGMVSFFFRKS